MFNLRAVLVPLLALLVATLPTLRATPGYAQQAATLETTCSEIASLADGTPYRLGLVIQNLATGERCEIGADSEFRSASLYKLVVLAQAYQQIDAGSFALDEGIVIEPRHSIDDPPELQLTEAITRNGGEAVRLMIQASANADALALRDRLGPAEVDGTPEWLGMTSTRLGSEYVTTPNDIAHYFEQLYQDQIVSPEASAAMRAVLLGQELNDLIPAGLPEGVPVAHKTGLLTDHLHDAGIVYAPGGDYILAILVEHPNTLSDATSFIRDVTALAHQPFAFAPVAEPVVDRSLSDAESAPAVAPAVIAGIEAGRQTEPASTDANLGEPPATAGSNPTNGGGFTLSFIPELPIGGTAFSALTIGILATLLGVFSYQFGLRRLGGQTYNRGAVNAIAGGGEGTAGMRLGIRKTEDQDELMVDADMFDDEGAAMIPASSSLSEVGAPPVMPSPRLERLAQFFDAQEHLLNTIRHEYEDETSSLESLLQRQSYTQQRMLANLETRLRPLNEYADGEEANLDALEQRMAAQGPDFIQRSFAEYLETQRRRISETRDQIDEQRLPLLRYGDEQRDSIEVALARFDADVEALELNLAEQRKLLMRMIDGMRSDSFVAVKGFLEAREASLAQLADQGITDPGQIAQSAQNLRDAVDAMASQSVHIQAVLEATDTSDEELLASSPVGPHALPNYQSFDAALAELEAAEEEAGIAEEIA